MSVVVEDGLERTYVLNGGTQDERRIPEADIIHHRRVDPDSDLRGLSPLEPLRATLEAEYSARRQQAAFWRNGARPSGFLRHPGNLSQPAAERLKASFDSRHSGVDNAGKTLVLEEGLEYQTTSLSAKESEYVLIRALNREETCAAYHMPPPAVGILDHATFANITEQFRSVYRDTMAPRLQEWEDVLDASLRPEFDASGDLYAEFLLDEVLRGAFEQRADALKSADWMTVAEKRAIENLPFIEGTDRIFIQGANVPLDAFPAAGETPAPPIMGAIQ